MRIPTLTLIVVLVCVSPSVGQEPVTNEEVQSLLAAGRCSEARLRIQNAPNRAEFLATGVGKAYYAGSLCFSAPAALSLTDISNALAHADSAESDLGTALPQFASWLDTVRNQCRRLERQVHRGMRDSNFASYGGKVMGGCTQNASPVLLQWDGGLDSIEAAFRAFSWSPIVSPLGEDVPPAAFPPPAEEDVPPAAFPPPEELVATARAEHMLSDPKVAICEPFLVLSASQKPEDVCRHIRSFYKLFATTYDAIPPGAWITIHHYASQSSIQEHAREFGGPSCNGLLGYFDWRRQAIAFFAPSGSFGTLQHEITHALMFSDMPLGPRWFEEGLAALYENTDPQFRGLPNPWRERILGDIADPRKNFFEEVLQMSAIEFEAHPGPATVARWMMIEVQQQGDLPSLYKEIRSQIHQLDPNSAAKIRPDETIPDGLVDYWRRTVEQYLSGPSEPE